MNKNLLVLEKEPQNKNALNAIFRSAHTLKSMSASMGYNLIADLSHKMEDVLDQLRTGTIKISEKAIDLLFQSFDFLEYMVSAVQEDKKIDKDIAPIMDFLDGIMKKRPQIKEEKVGRDLALNEFEKKILIRVKKEGFKSFKLKITLDKNCVLKGVRAFMVFRNLHLIGEVIKSMPSSQALEEEKFDREFQCIVISKEKEDIVKKKVLEVIDVEKAEIEEIKVDKSWDKISLEETSVDQGVAKGTVSEVSEHMRKIQSVRVDIKRLDKLMNLVEELAISKLRLAEIGLKFPDNNLKGVIENLSRLTDDLQTEVMQARLVPVGQVFERFPRLVRDLAKKENKKIKFEMIGGDIELDRTVLDEIGDPLIHLIKNAIDHGLETPVERVKKGKFEEGKVMLSARREKSHVFIEIEDDGKGMNIEQIKKTALKRGLTTEEILMTMSNDEIIDFVTHPGFSTKKEVTEVSGRGVGFDVAKEKAESLGGGIIIESNENKGSKITMRLPITTAVVQALLAKILGKVFAIPISSVIEIVVINESDIKKLEHQETILHRDKVLPIVRLEKIFQGTANSAQWSVEENVSENKNSKPLTQDSRLNIVVVEYGSQQFGIVVDTLLSQHDIVIKQLTKELKGIRGFAGATILGDGKVALVLDVATLI